jgi:hypothetical protein
MISAAIDMDNVKRRAEIARSQSIVYSKTRTDFVCPTPVLTRNPMRQSPSSTLRQPPPVELAPVSRATTDTNSKRRPDFSRKLRQERSFHNENGEDVLSSWGRDCDEIMKKLERLEQGKLNRAITL